MVDLSHWDFQDEFELAEVASLIAGVEPKHGKKLIGEISGIPSPIGKRVVDAAAAAYKFQLQKKPVPADCLQSNMLEVFEEKQGVLATIADMVLGGSDILVKRGEVARWLDAIGLQSKYVFKREAKAQATDELMDKHLSPRERTSYLNIIGAMLAQLTAGKANDTTVIKQALTDYPKTPGISERKLQEAFAAAKRSLGAS